MPWVDTVSIIYTGVVGSVIGGSIVAFIHNRGLREHEEAIEELLRTEVKRLKRQVIELQQELHLYTKPVGKSGDNPDYRLRTHVL